MQNKIINQKSQKSFNLDQRNQRNSSNRIQEIQEQIFDDQEDFKIQHSDPKIKTTNSLNNRLDEISEQKLEKPKTKQERSAFHNFQKHLVITLRKVIKIKKSINKKEIPTVAWQIWQNFTKQTKIYTKNILHIVFGVVDFESCDLINVYDEEILQKFGFSQIFTKYSDPLISQAQSFLRQEVVKQLEQVDVHEIMKKRRLSSTEGFYEYIKQFISELKQGPIRKRLPKNKKMQMSLKNKKSE